ncbi:NADH:ubiquinone oxidoreductase subunit M [Segatella copri]|nr:NADH:ubiquinone oxidoreductase subunit M [Segatella copri]
MLHAGVLMKLGGYGCFRIAMFLLPAATHGFWIKVFLVLTTISIVYGALSACVPPDVVSRFDDRPLLRRYRYDLSSGWYT